MQIPRPLHWLLTLLLAVWCVTGGGRVLAARVVPTTAAPAQVTAAAPGAPPAASLYDLEADEQLGGHTIERHVGRTDAELLERLRREPQISAASTYTDLLTARRVVAAALAQADGRVRAWSQRLGPRPNLVINYGGPAGQEIGRSLRRGTRVSTVASRALVVLRWLPREKRWIVLTSYPEAR